MAHASKKHFGEGAQGKGDGSGAMTHMDLEKIGQNDILSNRDKSRHAEGRGLDSKAIQSDQYQDHAANRILRPGEIENEFKNDNE